MRRRTLKRKRWGNRKKYVRKWRQSPMRLYRTPRRSRLNNQVVCLKTAADFNYNSTYDAGENPYSDYIILSREFRWFDVVASEEFPYYYNTFSTFTPIRMTVVWMPSSSFVNTNQIIYNNFVGTGGTVPLSTASLTFNAFDGYSLVVYDPVFRPNDYTQTTRIQINNHYFKPFNIMKRNKRKFYPRNTAALNQRQSFTNWNDGTWRAANERNVNGPLGVAGYKVRLTIQAEQDLSSWLFEDSLDRILNQFGQFWVYYFISCHDRR